MVSGWRIPRVPRFISHSPECPACNLSEERWQMVRKAHTATTSPLVFFPSCESPSAASRPKFFRVFFFFSFSGALRGLVGFIGGKGLRERTIQGDSRSANSSLLPGNTHHSNAVVRGLEPRALSPRLLSLTLSDQAQTRRTSITRKIHFHVMSIRG